jgi:hypothetical protein
MWTGLIEDENGRPRLFSSKKSALNFLRKLPPWGWSAVTVRECTVDGINYQIGKIIGSGAELTES